MFCSRTLNNAFSHIHEKVLGLGQDNCSSSFCDILEMSNKKPILFKNLEHVAKKIYAFLNRLFPRKMNNFFSFRENPNNLRNFSACIQTIRKLLSRI